MTDILDEIAGDERAEKVKKMIIPIMALLVLAMVITLGTVGGLKIYHDHQEAARQVSSEQFNQALHLAMINTEASRAAALTDFEKLAATGTPGYQILSKMQAASLAYSLGQTTEALSLWQEVSNDSAAPSSLQNVAELMWVSHQVNTVPPKALLLDIAPLTAESNPLHPLAREIAGLLQLKLGEKLQALQTFSSIITDPLAPPSVQRRARIIAEQISG